MNEVTELKREELSIQAISGMTGFEPEDDRESQKCSLSMGRSHLVFLDSHKPYLAERLQAGVWNARVLLHELRERDYTGGYVILTDWLRPQRQAADVGGGEPFAGRV